MSNTAMSLFDPAAYDHLWKMAGVFARSQLVPPHLRDKPHDCLIALSMAQAQGQNPLVVMQNIIMVSGRAGWAASYVIGLVNISGVFAGPIDWEVSGKGETLSVEAFATLAGTDRRVAVTCDMALAKAEGWTKNSKYQSMPVQMLKYRSATWLVRLYCPQILLGLQTSDEVEDIDYDLPARAPRNYIDAPADVARTALGLPAGSLMLVEDAPDLSAQAHIEPEPVATVHEDPAPVRQARTAPADGVPSDPEIVALQEEYDALTSDRAHRVIKDGIRKVVGIKPFTDDERRAYVAALHAAIAAVEPA